MGRSRSMRRRPLLPAAALAACLAAAGCQGLPGFEVERDATLTNSSTGSVMVFTTDSGGAMTREQTADAGASVAIRLGGGRCESGWLLQRGESDPVDLGDVCPGDHVTVTDEGVKQDN